MYKTYNGFTVVDMKCEHISQKRVLDLGLFTVCKIFNSNENEISCESDRH